MDHVQFYSTCMNLNRYIISRTSLMILGFFSGYPSSCFGVALVSLSAQLILLLRLRFFLKLGPFSNDTLFEFGSLVSLLNPSVLFSSSFFILICPGVKTLIRLYSAGFLDSASALAFCRPGLYTIS